MHIRYESDGSNPSEKQSYPDRLLPKSSRMAGFHVSAGLYTTGKLGYVSALPPPSCVNVCSKRPIFRFSILDASMLSSLSMDSGLLRRDFSYCMLNADMCGIVTIQRVALEPTRGQHIEMQSQWYQRKISSQFDSPIPSRERPRFGPDSQWIRLPNERMTSRLRSVEPSSMTMTSLFG